MDTNAGSANETTSAQDGVAGVQVCVVSRDPAVIAVASAAAASAELGIAPASTCAQCTVPCKPIVALDLANPDYVQSVHTAHRRGGARILIAIAPEEVLTQSAKDQGFQFVVNREIAPRFLPTVLRIARSLLR